MDADAYIIGRMFSYKISDPENVKPVNADNKDGAVSILMRSPNKHGPCAYISMSPSVCDRIIEIIKEARRDVL